MVEYGVTKTGFIIKPFQTILEEKAERSRAMFGEDVDLRSTSTLRKLLDISSFEDHELWKAMEQLYYSNFLSTASGDALDLLGEDVGVVRRFLPATGEVEFNLLLNEFPKRIYQLPIGTLVETASPVVQFRTIERVSLSDQNKKGKCKIEALKRGLEQNVAAGTINRINPDYVRNYLTLGSATIAVTNPQPTTGGEQLEDDQSYRDRLLGYPRTLWTLEAVRYVVKNIDGVRDCRLFDPSGGTDVSLSKFNLFNFSQRRFGTQRLLGTPYYFDILVALNPGYIWETTGSIRGLKETIEEAIREVRPISIFPNLRLANNVLIGLGAKVLLRAGQERNAAIAAIKDILKRRIDQLGLGNSVLYSEVLCDCMNVPGVIDVQQLRLRRCPPQFGGISFGRRRLFQREEIEFAVGENVPLQPDEIALFKIDSVLIDIEVSDR